MFNAQRGISFYWLGSEQFIAIDNDDAYYGGGVDIKHIFTLINN